MNSAVREPSTHENKRWFRKPEDWAALFVAPLIFFGIFLYFVVYHHYDPLAPETLVAFGILVGSGLIIGSLTVMARNELVRVAIFGLLLVLFCNIHFGLPQFSELEFIGGSRFLQFITFVGVFLPATLLLVALRRHMATILLAAFSIFSISTVILPPKPILYGPLPINTVAPPAKDLPPVVHIVLDAHIGIEGIPQDIEGGPELRQALLDFYLSRGFRVFGRAYSRYVLTRQAIASLMNAGAPNLDDLILELGGNRWVLNQNRYFDQMSDRGLLIRVYQNDYMSFCRGSTISLETCHKYSAASPRLFSDMEISIVGKSKLLISASLNSTIYRSAMKLYDELSRLTQADDVGLFPPRNRHTHTLFSLGALDVLDEVAADISAAPNGRVYFVHLLLPHAPYIYFEDCRVQHDITEWLDPRREYYDPDTVGTTDYRTTAYRRYFAQTLCLMKELDRVFDALKRSGAWDDATIILHGDHGSRITLRDPFEPQLDNLSPRDIIDSYSTFYAIRSPDTAAGYDLRTVAIQDLFAEQFLGFDRASDDAIVFSGPNDQGLMQQIELVPIGPN